MVYLPVRRLGKLIFILKGISGQDEIMDGLKALK